MARALSPIGKDRAVATYSALYISSLFLSHAITWWPTHTLRFQRHIESFLTRNTYTRPTITRMYELIDHLQHMASLLTQLNHDLIINLEELILPTAVSLADAKVFQIVLHGSLVSLRNYCWTSSRFSLVILYPKQSHVNIT